MTFLTQPIWVCPYLTQIWIKSNPALYRVQW